MNRLTLVPALGLIAIVVVLAIGAKAGMAEHFRQFALLLLLSFPVVAVGEVAAFAYDVAKRKNRISGDWFAARMALHSLGLFILIGACVVLAHMPNFHQ